MSFDRITIFLMVLGLMVIAIGCGEDGGPSGPEVTAESLVEDGWELFAAEEYEAALDRFLDATEKNHNYSDAYNGAGWCSGKIPGLLSEASNHFARSFGLDTTRYDALGGWTFVVYQSGQWDAAIGKADSLLHRRPVWQFLRQPSIDFHDIWLVEASAYCHLGNYDRALEIIIEHLNNSFDADPSTPAGRREILDEIERLGRVYG